MTLPMLLSLADELDNLSTRSYTDDFGFGFYPHRDYDPHHHHHHSNHHHHHGGISSSASRHQPGWLQRRHLIGGRGERERPVVKFEEEDTAADGGFEYCMDVQPFKPNELTVKTVDGYVTVEGKHDEREDKHGFIARHFVRRYVLPKDCNPNQVVSTLSSDGVLTIKVQPPSEVTESSKEHIVEIQRTGQVHRSANGAVKDNDNETKEEKQEADDEPERK